MKKMYLFFLLCVGLAACHPQKQEIPEQVIGLAPVYAVGDWQAVRVSEPQPIGELGKMYFKDGFIFAGERGKGIHIIDNRDPANPKRVRFVEIAGNTDVAIKGNLLYANNLQDLVVFNIADFDNIRLENRLENVFPQAISEGNYPADYTGFFECVDPQQGVVVYWEERLLHSPQCWR